MHTGLMAFLAPMLMPRMSCMHAGHQPISRLCFEEEQAVPLLTTLLKGVFESACASFGIPQKLLMIEMFPEVSLSKISQQKSLLG